MLLKDTYEIAQARKERDEVAAAAAAEAGPDEASSPMTALHVSLTLTLIAQENGGSDTEEVEYDDDKIDA